MSHRSHIAAVQLSTLPPFAAKLVKPLAVAQALVAYGRIVRDPDRLAEVFRLADSLSEPKVMARMADDIRARGAGQALADRHRIVVDLPALSRLGNGTFGRAYADFMNQNGLVPENIPSLEGEDEATYIRAHLYETHDIWHAATGFGADVAGELGLQAFYAKQLDGPLPSAILAAGLLNTALFSPSDRQARLAAIARGFELGARAKPLFGVRWDELWERPTSEVRAALGTS